MMVESYDTRYQALFGSPKHLQEMAEKVALRLMEIMEERPGIDAIACRGQSGIILGSIVAYITGLRLLTVRKAGESCHSQYRAMGTLTSNTQYVIIDDFIDSGATLDSIVLSIGGAFSGHFHHTEIAPHAVPRPAAVLLWDAMSGGPGSLVVVPHPGVADETLEAPLYFVGTATKETPPSIRRTCEAYGRQGAASRARLLGT